jgi:hypothetical protein
MYILVLVKIYKIYIYDIVICQENRINGRGDPLRWPRDTFYPQKLALTSPTSGGRSVGIVRSRIKGHGVCFYDIVIVVSIRVDKILLKMVVSDRNM